MKKIIILSGVLCLLSFSANAQVSIGLNLGFPQPSYVAEPGPAYVVAPSYPAYYQHRHYHHAPVGHDDHRGRH